MATERILPPSIIKGWDNPQNEYLQYQENGKLLKLVAHFWNACNLACPGCFVHKTTDPQNSFTQTHKNQYPDEMSFDTQLSLFEEAQSLGVKVVDIVGAGEPTLDLHFSPLIDKLIQLHLYPVIFTHGATPLFQDINKLSLYKDKPISFFIKLWSRNE